MGLECCGSGKAVSSTPTFMNDITYIEISNGIYDELFGSDNPDIEINDLSKKWDFDTRFYAKFKENLMAGNVDYAASMVSCIRIKRRKNNEHKWFTMCDIPIETNEDFDFELVDRYAQGSQDYYYAMIPVINHVEGNINKNEIRSEFNHYFILDKDISYPIIFNTNLSLELNKNIGVINTLGRKYPFVISNGMSQYKTGSLQFALAPVVNCEIETDDIYNYRTQFEEWLSNGKPKILKDWTGQIYMIDITSSVPIDLSYYQLPSYQIQFTEVGDALDETSMYMNGFIDIISTLSTSYPL
jgi:hypothetical protein